MTNTKWLSALLAGTALTVASTAAMADTSFLTMKRNAAGEGVTFAIAPTADMPAPATEVTVSGEVRGIVTLQDVKGADSTSDFGSRARVVVKGKTDTSVGEVGAYVRLNQSNTGSVDANKHYGYWQMSPEWQLLAGRTDSIAAIEAGIDWNFNGSLVGNVGGPTNATAAQARLTYASGPLTWAVAVQDATPGTAATSDTSDYGVGTALKFAAGTGIDLSVAGYAEEDNVGASNDYFVGAGANFALGSIASATAAVGAGKGNVGASYVTLGDDEKFTNASVGLTFGLSESTSLEIGYGYTNADDAGTANDVTAALLWSPAKQLTLGAGVGYESGSATTKTTTAGLGAWFKF